MSKTLRSPAQRQLQGLIKAARIDAGLTQDQLAAHLGKPQSYIAKVEAGERRIDVVEFLELSKAIGRDPCQAVQSILPAIKTTRCKS